MKTLLKLLLVLLLASVGDVAAQDVRYNFDRQANFRSFKTYKWVVLDRVNHVPALIDARIKSAVDDELSRKGLTRSESDTADLYIGYQTAIDGERAYATYDQGWGYGPGWYGGGMTSGKTSTIQNGQFVLDMYSTSAKTLVWRGVASRTLDASANPEKRDKALKNAVERMLTGYPPVENSRCPPDCKK